MSMLPVSARVYAASETVLPSKLCGVYFMVPLTVKTAGGTSQTLQFLLDTGSYESFLDPDSLARISGKARRYANRTKLKAAVGDFSLKRLPVNIVNLDNLEVALGTTLDGILGFHAFKDKLLTLDYPKKEIRVSTGRLSGPDGREVFSAKGRDKRPWLNVWLGARKLKLLVDSAAGGAITVRNLKGIEVAAPPVATSTGQHFDHTVINHTARAVHDLVIGRHRIERPVLSVVPETPVITAHIMWHFSFTFDQKNRRVRVSSPHEKPVHVPSQRASGLLLSSEEGALKILGVVAGSPAEAAGLQVGDRVVAIDNTPPEERGCAQHLIPEGAVLTFRRDKTIFRRRIARTTMIE